MIRVLALNINSPALDRAKRQLGALLADRSDIVILTEAKASASSKYLVDGLRREGYHVVGWSSEPFDGFTTLVASVVPYSASSQAPDRIQQVTLESTPKVSIIGAYGVSSDPFGRNSDEKVEAKRGWLESFVQHVRNAANENELLLVVGDLNFVDDRELRHYASLYDFERKAYADLALVPMADVYAGTEEFSWTSHQGLGYRFDHAIVSPPLAGRVRDARIVHEWRMGPEKLTDHSAVRLEIDAEFDPLETPDDAAQATLF
ncbi:MAG TPA: endonuclease/exonuclease/phosphatase family protein [Galbitalea sp.]|jgi:exodeoxyribonuclease-3